jgi:hypothetical protein
MRSVKIALVAGFTLLATGIGLTLARSPTSVAASNKVHGQEAEVIASASRGATYCQAGETLPQGTSAIRVALAASIGPHVKVIVSAGARPITGGEQESGWTGSVVTVPLEPLPRAASGVTVCVSFRLAHETLGLVGRKTPARIAARQGHQPLAGRTWIEYLRPGTRSWASLASSIVRNMGFGRADGGAGIVLLALALLVSVGVLTARMVLTGLR